MSDKKINVLIEFFRNCVHRDFEKQFIYLHSYKKIAILVYFLTLIYYFGELMEKNPI